MSDAAAKLTESRIGFLAPGAGDPPTVVRGLKKPGASLPWLNAKLSGHSEVKGFH